MNKLFTLFLFIHSAVYAIDPYKRNDAIDVQHYLFQLEVNDSTDLISGVARVTIRFTKPITSFDLDLINKNAQGLGMTLSAVTLNGKSLSYQHQNDRLNIQLAAASIVNEQLTFEITYAGIPLDGFIIGKNKFGDRGFFGDNWPDRGHHWLPVIDHPSDKASVTFVIIAPHHYSVVANGIQTEETFLNAKQKLTRYEEEVAIPVKVMVVGIARFAVQRAGVVDGIVVESWVYPQNKVEGFSDYATAVQVLDFFHRHIGPYPFKKLANVQSKTRWGGLENAGAIFYAESSVNGKGDHISLIAHEEAHQWFGNSASENDWHHVWLSEGFATYFANLYLEHTYGHDQLVKEQMTDREQVIKYYAKNPAPVVDTTLTDINKVLSINTYQKAGWVLHMLRHKVGDALFWKGIQTYYARYQKSNALTDDFRLVMEEVTEQNLKPFFDQWLFQAGHPRVSGNWSFNSIKKELILEINQIQKEPFFSFPLDVAIISKDGHKKTETVQIDSKSSKITLKADFEPSEVKLDPNTWLLFEGQIQKK